MNTKSTTYINPYLGGFLLGLVLLAAFLIGGHGLGSSGAFKNMVIKATAAAAPAFASARSFFNPETGSIWHAWVFVMFLGVVLGGFISGAASGRLKFTIERGPRIKPATRLVFAVIGGMLFGFGAQLGKGCTSGAALSGMAVLSTSGIITMMAIFGTGYAIAAFFRKLWV
ncbi:MAG TPA: YeeE/YedE thiosulfate transporter family protein [Bacteroidales bacterium]|nr:YeeE/YedE thiosulfate transporter family protein [Bacteroidales bacterium]HRZ49396.1 YeeE/YedE thiosulfate transporter family protein [Bacteroidales bacterium]